MPICAVFIWKRPFLSLRNTKTVPANPHHVCWPWPGLAQPFPGCSAIPGIPALRSRGMSRASCWNRSSGLGGGLQPFLPPHALSSPKISSGTHFFWSSGVFLADGEDKNPWNKHQELHAAPCALTTPVRPAHGNWELPHPQGAPGKRGNFPFLNGGTSSFECSAAGAESPKIPRGGEVHRKELSRLSSRNPTT